MNNKKYYLRAFRGCLVREVNRTYDPSSARGRRGDFVCFFGSAVRLFRAKETAVERRLLRSVRQTN